MFKNIFQLVLERFPQDFFLGVDAEAALADFNRVKRAGVVGSFEHDPRSPALGVVVTI